MPVEDDSNDDEQIDDDEGEEVVPPVSYELRFRPRGGKPGE